MVRCKFIWRYYLYDKSCNSSETVFITSDKTSYLLYKSKRTFINIDETSDHCILLYDSDYNSEKFI